MSARLNRIPRMPANNARLSLCGRLYNRLARLVLEVQVALLAERCRTLRHGIALDLAAATYHAARFQRSPVLQRRLSEEREALAKATQKLNDKIHALAQLELRS